MSNASLKKILLLLFFVMIGIDAYQMWRIAFVRHEADFPAYLAGAHGLLNGTNPYVPISVAPYNSPPFDTPDTFRPFIYPLFVAWLWVPFALPTPLVASFLWFSISVGVLIVVLQLLARILNVRDERQRLLFFISIVILFSSVIQADLMYGQMNLLVLLMLLIGVEYLEKNPITSGFGFGAAISAKFMPIVLLPVIAFRSFRVSIVTLATILILTLGVPFLIAGPKIFEYYQYWFQNTLSGEITRGDHGYSSFDLASVLAQLGGMPYPPTLMRAVCGLILLVFPLILIRKGSARAGFFLSFILLPLTASRSEPAHLIVLIPAISLLVVEIIGSRFQVWKWSGLIVMQLMILWGFNKAIPFDTFGLLALFEVVFMIGMKARRSDKSATTGMTGS